MKYDEHVDLDKARLRKLTVFVVDDEPTALETLSNDLLAMEEVGEVYCFSSYEEATLPLLELQPGILFLDVEMPGRNGLDFLESVQKRINFPIRVVFYTAFSDYMLDAIRCSASDFLLKPYKLEELHAIVGRMYRECASPDKLNSLYTNINNPRRKLAIQTICELLLLTVDELLMLQYNKDTRSWFVSLTDGTQHKLRYGTKAEDLLALHPSLSRVSSNCIVNVAYLSAIENTTLRCRFCPPYDNVELFASRRYFSKLKEKFEII